MLSHPSSRLLLLVLCVGDAQAYSQQTSGQCEFPIASVSDCSAAAVALGLSDTSTAEQGGSVSHDPPGCWFEQELFGSYLYFNTGGANTGACSTDDLCLCDVAPSPEPAPPPPLPPPPRRECSAYPACSALDGDCCPTDNGVYLGYCHAPTPPPSQPPPPDVGAFAVQ